jgi:hypothetical protein
MEDKPVTPEPETKLSSPFDMIEKVTKAAVLVLAVSYGLGLIVTNQYLAPLGISDFSSLKPKYVLTGLWTLLLLALGSFPLTFKFIIPPKAGAERYYVTIPVGLFMSILNIAIFLVFVLGLDISKGAWPDTVETFSYLIGGGCFAAFYCRPVGQDVKTDRSVIFNWFMVIVSLCVTLVPVTKGIAQGIYRHVPEALGGGEPIGACVMLKSEKGAAFWKQAGINPLKPEEDKLHLMDDRTKLVLIVYQDEKNILVEGNDPYAPKEYEGKTVLISKDLVEGYVLNPIKGPCGLSPTPAPSPSPSSSAPAAPPRTPESSGKGF